jgi:hypothetical protein
MHGIQCGLYPDDPDKPVLPCDYFDMVAGTDMGGSVFLLVTAFITHTNTSYFQVTCSHVHFTSHVRRGSDARICHHL